MTMAPPRTLAAFIDQTGGRAACLALSRDPNAKVTILLFPPGAARPAYVAKVPTTDAAALSVEREAERLAEVGDRVAGPVSATIPELVATVEHLGRPVLVMTALPGQSMLAAYHSWRHTARREAVAADFAAAGDWLAGLHSAVGGNGAGGAKGAGGANGQASVARMLDGVADVLGRRFGGQAGADADLAQLAALCGRLEGHRTPQSVVHGDFWAGNLLTERGRVLGVIDWEHARLTGSPVRDLARFATSYSLYLDRHTRQGRRVAGHPGLRAGRWGGGVDYAVDGTGWYPDLLRSFVRSGLERLGMSPSCWRDVLLADLATIAASADHDEFARNHLLLFRRLTGGQS
jgi:aminoglycoside phosphotransferase (APT) family kinase protein